LSLWKTLSERHCDNYSESEHNSAWTSFQKCESTIVTIFKWANEDALAAFLCNEQARRNETVAIQRDDFNIDAFTEEDF
jgi:hypothetical protein